MDRRMTGACALALAFAVSLSIEANAQLAVSANDGKATLVDGANTVPNNPAPDTVTIVDLGASPPKVVGEVQAPTSVVGPPQSVAVARDQSIALVTASSRLDPADPKKVVPDDRLTIIDLKASPPAVLGTVQAGRGAAGVSINDAGTLVLVANRMEGTVSVFTVDGKRLTPAGKIDLGNERSGPSHVAFTPDGRTALVTRDGDHKISMLTVDGNKVEYTKRDIAAGLRPYSLEIRGGVGVVGNIGVGGGDADTISLIDLQAKPPRVVGTATVGQTPEGVALSPDGKFVAVTVMNGSNKPKSSPFFNDNGLVRIFAIKGTQLRPVADAKVGRWCQGAAWSRNGKTLLVQCMTEKELQVLSFDGRQLKKTGAIALSAGPAGIGTAR